MLGVDDPVLALRFANELTRVGLAQIDLAGLPERDQAMKELAAEELGDGALLSTGSSRVAQRR
jgi:hypothetical protein